MCTGLSLRNGNHHYFGRNLDLEIDYPVDVVITPRNKELPMRHVGSLDKHYAIYGVGMIQDDYPLYFDACNEKGLGMAGLAFWTSCHYNPVREGKLNLTSFEILQYVLGNCATVAEAKDILKDVNITDDAFSATTPPSPLHWLISDRTSSIVVEQTKAHGLVLYDNPYDVLANEPEFPFHINNLAFYANVSNKLQDFNKTRFAPEFPDFVKLGAGMGTSGLPGGLDSISRFVKIAFGRLNSVSPDTEEGNVSQFFRLLESVIQCMGSDEVKENQYEITQFTTCYNTDENILYYTTYSNQSLNGIKLAHEDLDSDKLVKYDFKRELQVCFQN